MFAFALFPGYLQYGNWHLPVFGLFAAVGLVLALLASQRTAVLAQLPAQRLWDAGMFAVFAAFVSSRLLLVISDYKAFQRYPLLVLSLPSLTYGGLAITAVLVVLWLLWKRLPLLYVADAWAPCAALLWMVLSIGHLVEGTDAGMPTTGHLAMTTPGDTVLGPVHPVQIYAAVFALCLAAVLWLRLPARKYAGDTAALGLILGGSGSFLLGMLRQPTDTYGDAWLDPSQWIALGAILVGGVLVVPFGSWFRKRKVTPSRAEVADVLEAFIRERGGRGLDIVGQTVLRPAFSDPQLRELQDRVAHMPVDYPTNDQERFPWCSEKGLQLLHWYVVQLRSNPADAERKAG